MSTREVERELDLVDQILTQLAPEAPETPASELEAIAQDFASWAAAQPREAQAVRASTRDDGEADLDILEIVGPDMPFLVDSVMGEVAEQGFAPYAMAHPITRGPLGARSHILVLFRGLPLGAAARLAEGVRETLAEVRLSVADFAEMRAKMREAASSLAAAKIEAEGRDEAVAFLTWLSENRFTFLGVREIDLANPSAPAPGLGVLRDPARRALRRGADQAPVVDDAAGEPLIVSKASFVSKVHRRSVADYLGVKRYDKKGEAVAEVRFVGLFGAEVYNEPTRTVPILRRKLERVRAAGGPLGGHDTRVLNHVLETFPRDELFQMDEAELRRTALAIVHLLDRPRARLFVRTDRYGRYATALVYVPKDRFNTALREAVGELLTRAYGGAIAAFYPELGDQPLARIRFTIQDIDPTKPAPDLTALEREIAALTRTWEDGFDAALRAGGAQWEALDLAARYRGGFTAGYRERNEPLEALADLAEIERLDGLRVGVRAFRREGDGPAELRCKIYAREAPLPLSSIMPALENMGLRVAFEIAFPIRDKSGAATFVHELATSIADGGEIAFDEVKPLFEEAFAAIWAGETENDRFNSLVLRPGMRWREAALIRALARFRTQTGLDPAQSLQTAAFSAYPEVARLILGLFRVRFDPALPESNDDRAAWSERLLAQIEQALERVASLDHDRALRRVAGLVSAITRTNYYQPAEGGGPKRYISFKIESQAVADLPAPKPYREIWVWSPEVEGVHLRFGPVARGGLRWSDRRDDFRIEVLELVKAQQVKNAIIVPVGAKGGFYPKRLPSRDDRAGYAAAGQAAYRTFLRGLLDVTDNIVGGEIVPPRHVVRWDGDDAYLVVAADKGTATFSDIANAISAEYGHWLGDAFASGGSVGYDHKAMGITAKGAWEAVKRHFRELGRDIQKEPFDVIGVGDMSGDVFGNGMLLSRAIRLVAAFDHRDIFIDPNPDPARAWAERQRLFALPASSWKDYDPSVISEGGGVFSRAAKSIQLSPEARARFGLDRGPLTPNDLIKALLTAETDLLWFGGIGNFIKAAREANLDVGDKANDPVRVDAEQVRARVIGEGANLGVTQAGRVAFARAGGRINTDAIDNSAGVDTSDHEVNIKILLAEAEQEAALSAADRAPLLAAMTSDVESLVLRHNIEQTLSLSLAESRAVADLDAHERLMQRLEAAGKLDRKVEGLPGPTDMAALREAKRGLTRPELSKLLAYAKIDLFDALVASDAPDDAHFATLLDAYFPERLRRYEGPMRRHRLRREIIATELANWIVDVAGPAFVLRLSETTHLDAAEIAKAAEAARRVFEIDALRAQIHALDLKVASEVQLRMFDEVAEALRRFTVAMARLPPAPIAERVERYAEPVREQRAALWELMTPAQRADAEARRASYRDAGAPEALAADLASLPHLSGALDVADLARVRGLSPTCAARLHRAIAAALGLDMLRIGAAKLALADHWQRLSLRRMLETLSQDHRRLTAAAAEHTAWGQALDDEDAAAAVARWLDAIGPAGKRATEAVCELQSGGEWTYPKVVLAAAELRGLAA